MSAQDHLIAAHDYFSLCRASLILKPFIRRASVAAVQAIVTYLSFSWISTVSHTPATQTYMGQYLDMSDAGLFPGGSSRSWLYIGFSAKLAQSVGSW